ncbi:GPR1/FUN34/yaaH family-domain-containing protein, partial [Zopfochytrium polystomum]
KTAAILSARRHQKRSRIRQQNNPGPSKIPRTTSTMPAPINRVADGTPLALLGIAAATLVVSLVQIGARGTTLPFIWMPIVLFYGGLASLIGGIMQFINMDVWGATTFTSVAGYFFQIGYIFVPSSGVLAAYANSPEELDNALGFVFLSFTIVFSIVAIGSLRTTVVTTITLSTIAFMFILLTAGRLSHNTDVLKASGYVGLVLAAEIFYSALWLLAGREILGFELPHWPYALMGKRTGAAGADVEAAVVTVGKHEGATEDHFLTKEGA